MRPTHWLAQVNAARRLGKEVLDTAHVHIRKAASQVLPSTSTQKGPLHDWTVSVKDNICTLDMPTSCSSLMLGDYMSPIEATAVKLLRRSGANIIAKTNCDEFGMGSANLYSAYGPVLNPESYKGEERVAGGSSGGSAASVACSGSRISLASDTGGSIRMPAAYCGVYGFKPSYGLISRWGLISYADSLDTVGILGSASGDVRKAFEVISQHDSRDPTSVSPKVRGMADAMSGEVIDKLDLEKGPLGGLRIGVPADFFPPELSSDMISVFREALGKLKSLGAELVSVRLPNAPFALSAYYVLASAEASSNLAKYDGIRYGKRAKNDQKAVEPGSSRFHAHISKTRSEGFGAEVQKRILLGTYSLTSDLFDNYFLQAQKVRNLIRQDFDQGFRIPNMLHSRRKTDSKGVDVLFTPTTVDIAPTVEQAASMGISNYTQDFLTVPASLAGLPSLNVPAGRARGMPVGASLTTQWGCDQVLLRVAESLEGLKVAAGT
jgi:aspartyl-tRNA(Asn)/glutamyl-tRNA(Gln) amidotransferase subunit A